MLEASNQWYEDESSQHITIITIATSMSMLDIDVLLIQHIDFDSIPTRHFLLPSESYPNHQLNNPHTRQSKYFSYRIRWMLNSDGWMMIHDLKGWMKFKFLKGWLKCLQLQLVVKFMFHSIIGSMKLHDLTGWLKESTILILFLVLSFNSND